MNMNGNASVYISLDMKKYRIRIPKTMLHQLDDPDLIQLLINPKTLMMAIRAVDQASSGDQTHRILKRNLRSANSVEIYSLTFITKLKESTDLFKEECLYHVAGKVIDSERMAVFSLETAQKHIDSDGNKNT